MINKYVKTHIGIMPVRVLQHNVIYSFENMNPAFLELSQRIISQLNLDPGISYLIEEGSIKSPYALFKKIFIQEAFLSYVWCIAFSLTVLYEEVNVKSSRNYYFSNQEEVMDQEKIQDAYHLWEYAISLIKKYSEWNKELLPNPEYYDEKYEELIPKVNSVYLVAMNFILAHEFAHIELEHDSRIDSNLNKSELSIQMEKEADARAFRLVFDGINSINAIEKRIGILIGLCSLLFFKSTTREDRYPDVDERIDAIISVVNPEPMDPMWGIATLAYRLWDNLFQKNLVWQSGLKSTKELYYSIKHQVKR